MTITPAQLDALFDSLKQRRFAVIGDFCIDVYLFLDATGSEVSVETGLRTNAVHSMRLSAGGAGNVTANLTAMGATEVLAFGIRGNDLYGREYERMLAELGVKTEGFIVQDSGWATCTYTKVYEDTREQPRVDFGNFNTQTDASCNALLAAIEAGLPKVDLFLVNQQLVRGIHTPAFRAGLAEIVRAHPEKTFILDARDYVDDYDGMIRKLNDSEAARAAGFPPEDCSYRRIDTLTRIGRVLYHRWAQPVIITRGDRGSVLFDGTDVLEVPGLHLTRRIDTVGAGDSIFAGLAAAFAAGLPHRQSLEFATAVAGVTIQKLFQTGTASEGEIRAIVPAAEYRINPELAESPELASYWNGSECEVVGQAASADFRYAIFDHDGTISTLREGWETIMEPFMVESVLGENGANVDRAVRAQVTEDVHEYIQKTTGVQTLVQMEGLADLVRAFNLVPESEIRDAAGYKQRYLDRLNRHIATRTAKLSRAELQPSDFTINGAVGYLKRLSARGIRLYLASGTDEEDARREAHLLGYADLFNGGIYGARGDIHHDPKKAVLEMILAEIGRQNAPGIVTFGDGPVEIRETWKRGGTGIGVASDEVRRFGLNPAKRKRLVLAGATAIVPDFSQPDALDSFLFEGARSQNE